MIASAIHKTFSLRCLTMVAVLIWASGAVSAQEKEKKPAAKPAVKSAPAAASKGAAGNGGASKGPTTAGRGPTTNTAGRGPTTSTAGREGTTTGRGAGTPAGRGAGAPAGRGAGTSAARGTGAGPRGAEGRAPNGSRTVRTAGGNEVRMRPGGRPGDVHVANRGMDIHHGLNGDRRVSVERADHSRIVAERGGRGYVQRPYMYRGREFAHRTYYVNGRAYDRFYSRYPYHGIYLEGYAPGFYYAPAFYGWAYNPWVAPIQYTWGFAANPWYGYYGFYFTPYPVYPSASVWLTDYLISQTLAASYQAQIAAAQAQAAANAAPPPDAVPLTPQVKDMIAAEVQRQIALENAEAQTVAQNSQPDPASSGVQRMLTDNVPHIFVAGRSLDVVDTAGTECAISDGDALQLAAPPPPNSTAASLVVLSEKGGQECRKGATVSVEVADLQEMQNHMRETIDQGMGELKSKQSQGGLPAVPPSANAAPVKTAMAAEAPPPDPAAATEINQQLAEADKAEQEVLTQVPQDAPGSPAAASQSAAPAGIPATIALGQSVDDVTGALGQPKNIVDLGAKKIYVYKDMKITFNDGKVTDVQ